MEVPHSVSIVTETQPIPMNRLLVMNGDEGISRRETQRELKFGACVSPFYGHYDKVLQLIEFLEIYHILGIEQFVLYNKSMSNVTACALKEYVSEGWATLMPFQHDLTMKDIKYANQNSGISDCLYRIMYNFSHVAFLDLDDIIIPARDETIPQLIKRIEKKETNGGYAVYIFMNSHFPLQFPDDPTFQDSNDPVERSLTFLLKTTRAAIVNRFDRPKSIIKPAYAVDMGQHRVHELVNTSFAQRWIQESEGFYHHYRLYNPYQLPPMIRHAVLDRTAFRYKDRLTAAVRKRWTQFQKACGVGDIEMEKYKMYKPGDPASFFENASYPQLLESYNELLESLSTKNKMASAVPTQA